MKNAKTLVLIDGSSYLYRAYHALPAFSNSKGQPTGAVYGVANMLRKLQQTYDTPYFSMVLDPKGKTFRVDLYQEYKAHRPPMPEDLQAQVEPLKTLISAMGITLIIKEGYEADDVIATLTSQAKSQGFQVVISTGDKDMAQLVDDQVSLINTMNNTLLDSQGVMEKFGVPPARIVDYLALMGDQADNIPGIPGVGPKTAVKWLNHYGSLDEVIRHAAEINGKVGENLRQNLHLLPLSRQLATTLDQVPLGITTEELRLKPIDPAQLIPVLQHLEFHSWLEQLQKTPDNATPAPALDSQPYVTVWDTNTLANWITRLKATPEFSFDTETTSLVYLEAELVGVSFAVAPAQAAYVPVAHCYLATPPQLTRDQLLIPLQTLFHDPSKTLIGHNVKYDLHILANLGISVKNQIHDTMLMSYVYNSTASRHDLDSLALKFLNQKGLSFAEVAGKGTRQITFDLVDIDTATRYSAQDADFTLQLKNALWPRLSAIPTLTWVYTHIELPLVPVLLQMERHGVLIDCEQLNIQGQELGQRIAQLEQQAWDMVGHTFNLGSPKQLQTILFDQFKLPVLRKTPTGQASTAEDVLEELAWDYPLPKVILEHRSLSKLKSTYVDKLPTQINLTTRRVHTSYHQAVASTGRLSSTDPNLQNIPIRTDAGRRIRQAFIAPSGHQLLSADYSQIELRIMAHLSEDPQLVQAFHHGLDIHRATAADIFAVPENAVDDNQRRSAKAINFGLIYGMSAFGLSKQLGIERHAAQEYMDLYFSRYPGVKAFMEHTREKAHRDEYVETVFGRRLYLPDINSKNHQSRLYAERTAINAPMQGTAADIIKLAMITVHRLINTDFPHVKMIMQVHDELVFEVPLAQVEVFKPAVTAAMVNAAQLTVPLVVDIGIGQHWGEAH